MRLFPNDLNRLLKILPELYAYRQPLRFLQQTVPLVQPLVRADLCAWTIFEFTRAQRLAAVVESEPRATLRIVALLEESILAHPFAGYWMQSPGRTVLMLMDFAKGVREALPNNEVYRHLDVRFELVALIAFGAQQSVGLSFLRKTHPFTERDRLVVHILEPHLQRAFANAQLVADTVDQPADAPSLPQGDVGLTARESDVAFWMTHGKTNWEIGMILHIAARTVEKHVESVLRKLRVENRTAAALQLRERFVRITPDQSPLKRL